MSQFADAARKFTVSAQRGPALLVGVIALAALFAFSNGVENLFKRWGEQQELSHGYFLPLIAGWMLWARRDALKGSLGRPATIGLAGVAVSCLLLMLSELTVTSLMVFQHLAMVLLLGSLALALGGRGVFKLTLLPVAFLLFMVPPPYWVITVLSWKFQFWSSELGVLIIQLFGIPVFLTGNIIDLGDYQLQVAEACSGLRYLFPFLSLGFLAAYLYEGPLWQRAIIVVATVPITIVMNSVRVAVTAILVQQYGTQHAEGFLHLFEGWVVFLMCMAMLFAVIVIMARLSGQKGWGGLLALPAIAPAPAKEPWTEALFRRNALIAIALLAVSGAVVHLGSDDTLRAPERADLDGLLEEFEGWRVVPREVDSATLETLGADDYLVADLVNPQDEALVNLYVAYISMQRDGHSWHSPRQCIPGGGWKILSHDVQSATRADGRAYHYNRIVIENRGHRQLVYYWYDQRGRKIANEFVMKFALLFDAVRLQRTDGAMIRLITPINANEPAEAADHRLEEFMAGLEPKLPPYVPPAGAPLAAMAAD